MTPKANQPSVYSVDEARDAVLAAIPRNKKTELLPVINSIDRVVSADIIARHAIPPFRNSAMDGYAIRFSDYRSKQTFKVVGTSLAGHPYQGEIPQNAAVKITTGAMVPTDADTIVIKENTVTRGDSIIVEHPPKLADYLRYAGDDIAAGSRLVSAGTRITPAHAGLISAQGIQQMEVCCLPAIAVFSTGDELTEAGNNLQPGAIFDSNRTTITALLKKAGFPSTDLGILKDDEHEIAQTLKQLDDFDFVISSGGVSVGEADHMKAALEATGSLHFWKVAMKPGKPLVTGSLANGAFYFGLPGNPVSSMVTCLQFVIPALRSYSGHSYRQPPHFSALSESTLRKEAGRFEYQRGNYRVGTDGRLTVTTTGMQDSHVLHSMSSANCFICLEADSTGVDQGEEVNIVLFDTLAGVAG